MHSKRQRQKERERERKSKHTNIYNSGYNDVTLFNETFSNDGLITSGQKSPLDLLQKMLSARENLTQHYTENS